MPLSLALALALSLPGQRPPNRTGPPAPSPAVFDVRAFGAQPGDNADDAPAINAAILAASPSGGVVYLPGGPYHYADLLAVRATSGVTIRGDGPRATRLLPINGYAGPGVVVGGPALPSDVTAANRPVLGASEFDGSVELPKWGVATLGRAALVATPSPLQFGPRTDGNGSAGGPSNWRGDKTLTVGVYWSTKGMADGTTFLGCQDKDGRPLPWSLVARPGGVQVLLATAAGLQSPSVPMAAAGGRLDFAYTPSSGEFTAWVDGAPKVFASLPPPSTLVPHDGVTPFVVGGGGPGGGVTPTNVPDVTFKGFRVVWGDPVYREGDPAQTLAGGGVAQDRDRYFSFPPGTASVLPLSDPPGKLWVQVSTPNSDGAALWAVPSPRSDTSGVVIENLAVENGAPGVLVGRHNGLQIRDVSLTGGPQGLGSVPIAYSWPLVVERCEFGGWESAVFLYGQGVWSSMRDLNLSASGRDGIRLVGWAGLISNVLIAPPPPWGERAVDVKPVDDGVDLTLERISVDNENGRTYSQAVLRAEQGAVFGADITVTSLTAGDTSNGIPLIDLVGHGVGGAYLRNSTLTATRVRSWTGGATAVRAGPGWDATADGRAVSPAGPSPAASPPSRP